MSYKMRIDSIGRSGTDGRVRLNLVALSAGPGGAPLAPGSGGAISGDAGETSTKTTDAAEIIGGNLVIERDANGHPNIDDVVEVRLNFKAKA